MPAELCLTGIYCTLIFILLLSPSPTLLSTFLPILYVYLSLSCMTQSCLDTQTLRLSSFLSYTPLILPRHCSTILRLTKIGVKAKLPLFSFSTAIFRTVYIFLALCCHVNWSSCRLRRWVFPCRADISFTFSFFYANSGGFVQTKGIGKKYCPSINV